MSSGPGREATPDRRPDAAQRHLQADDVVRVAGGLGHDRCILSPPDPVRRCTMKPQAPPSAAIRGLRGGDGRRAVEGQAQGVEDADAASSRGLQNRPDIGVEARRPISTGSRW